MNTRIFLKELRARLEADGVEPAAFEARTLFETAVGRDRAVSLYVRNDLLDESAIAATNALLQRRLAGEPLQYLVGAWDFLDSSFFVGEGVLIPRPETEELVLAVLERLKRFSRPVVFDLCSGSGCIGLSVKRRKTDAQVYLFEKSNQAMPYLIRNREALGFARTVPIIEGDVLRGAAAFSTLPRPHVIVSNPPYIPSNELPALQREVQREPSMALDGGDDGLLFYRCFAEHWLNFLQPGGFFAFECGEDQAQAIAALFRAEGCSTEILCDFNNTERFVFAEKTAEKGHV